MMGAYFPEFVTCCNLCLDLLILV